MQELRMKLKVLLIVVLLATFSTTAIAFQFTFTPRTSASGEYNDNIFLTEDNEEDDYITTVSVGFTAALMGRTSGIEISYDPAYEFYDEFDEFDGWIHNAVLNAWSDLTQRTRLEVINRFLFTRDPLGDEDYIVDGDVIIPGDTTLRRTREEYYTNTAIARINHQFGEDDLVYAQFLYGILRNDALDVEDNDRYEPSIGLNYWFGPKFGIETMGAYTRGEYDRDSDFIGTPTDDFDNWFGSVRVIGRTTPHFSLFGQYDHTYRDVEGDFDNDYTVYAPSAGFLYMIEEDLSLRLGVGYFFQDIDNEDDEEGYFINAEINKTWNFRRGAIGLVGESGLEQNDFGAETLGLERFGSITASANYSFTRNFLGNISGYYRYSDIINDDDIGDAEEENRYRFGAGLEYLPFTWMTWGLDYEFNKLDQKGGGFDDDYEENRVMFTVTLQPDQPWMF
jgi:hypothetical protein